MEMHHRYEQDLFGLSSVNQGKGETIHEDPPEASGKRDTAFGVGGDALERSTDFFDEFAAKAFGLPFVEPGSRDEFFFRLRVEGGTFQRSDARAFRKTVAARLALTLPV